MIDERSAKRPFYTLQAGRGIAALLVALFHLNGFFAKPKYFGREMWNGLSLGMSGVAYFFVLSGFIIFYIHVGDIGAPARLKNFLRRRFVRIYPLYWVILLFMLPIYFLVPSFGTGHELRLSNLFADVTLLPVRYVTALTVAWTLKHEILFYLVFAVLIVDRRAGTLLATVFTLGGLFYWLGLAPYDIETGGAERPSVFILFNPLHLLFLMGAGCAWLSEHRRLTRPFAAASAGILFFIIVQLCDIHMRNHGLEADLSFFYGLACSLGIIGFVELERQEKVEVPRWLRLLGDASYCVYLIHGLLFSILLKILFVSSVQSYLPMACWFAAILGLTLAGGIVCHLCVEKPLLARCKSSVLPPT